MALVCDHCGKGIQRGHNVSHSKRRTAKTWRPNLQVYHLRSILTSPRKKVKLCVGCLRRAKEQMRKLMQKEAILKIKAPQLTPSAVM